MMQSGVTGTCIEDVDQAHANFTPLDLGLTDHNQEPFSGSEDDIEEPMTLPTRHQCMSVEYDHKLRTLHAR